MAANFWDSTQWKHWQFSKEELAVMRQRLEDEDPALVQMYPLPEWRHMNIYFNQQINRLGKRLSARQQAMATAQMYIKRFYIRVEIRRTNPLLVAVTAVYLACKMEEMPQHIRHVMNEARNLWPGTRPPALPTSTGKAPLVPLPSPLYQRRLLSLKLTLLRLSSLSPTADFHTLDISKIGECEFFLISEMHSQLIIHQPYRTLASLQLEFSLTSEESSLAWSFVNDHYMTDLPLLYPPHTIALAAIMLALVLLPSNQASGGGTAGLSGNGNGGGGAGGPLNLNMGTATTVIQQTVARAGIQGATHSPAGHPQHQQQQYHQQQQQQQQQQQPGQRDASSKVQRFATWLSESAVDMETMIDCTQELIAFYECHEQYNDKGTRDSINRFVKARGL